MDTSLRRIVITESEDLDLDELLLVDNSRAEQQQQQASPSPPPSSPPSPSPSSSTPRRSSSPPPSSPPASSAAAQCADGAESPTGPILAQEEGDDDWGGADGHWILPKPAQPGDYLSGSLHRIPSKSILKKKSSYGNFSSFDASTSSRGGGPIARPTSSASLASNGSAGRNLDTSWSGRVSRRIKQSSLLGISQASSNSSSQVSIGWNLDDSSPKNSPAGRGPFGLSAMVAAEPLVPLPSMPNLKSDGDEEAVTLAPIDRRTSKEEEADDDEIPHADGAAGMDASGSSRNSASSSGPRMRRNVSFHSVDVREYDRIIGDNPSCRSGPPLSLDWSYSKESQKDLDEYEIERSSSRVDQKSKLFVNKYKRRNMLAFHWGHTEEEMKEARRHTKKTQRQRSITRTLLPLQKAEEVYVSVRNFISKERDKGAAGVNERDDMSDISNSASTRVSTTRSNCGNTRASPSIGQPRTKGPPSSNHTA